MTPTLPELMEELVEDFLLRFPPDDPASLVRAAVVCKLWCRLITGTEFRRRFRKFHCSAAPNEFRCRFREFHRSATPLLGMICTGDSKPVRVRPWPTAYMVRTTSTGLVHAPDGRTGVATDARHGRVLLYRCTIWHTQVLSVWDPITDEQRDLPELPFSTCHDYCRAVVCAATAGGNCSHVDCHRGPFLVVVMDIHSCVVYLSVYSSEAGAWSHLPGFELPIPRRLGWFRRPPSVVLGSALYLLIPLYDEIVRYNFATGEVSAIPLPSKIRPLKLSILLTDDDGEIGFVVEKDFSIFLLPDARRERNTPGEESVSSTAAEDGAVPASPPKRRRRRRRRRNTRVAGATWQV